MSVTVVIPVYDAASFVADTVRSALAQSHRDLRVRIAVEPGAADAPHEPEASLAALAPFRGDPRVAIEVNAARLGWTANTNALLATVDTPFFAILPHDDLWHPRYVETLLPLLTSRPDASVAYCDIRNFGPRRSWRSGLPIRSDADTIGQMFDFFLNGPRGMPWRGLTRTDTLGRTGGLPAWDDIGILAETEYALRLVAAGRVLHHPAVLFAKRTHAGERTSASQDRAAASLDARRAGLQRHWNDMRQIVLDEAARGGLSEQDLEVLDALVLSRRLARAQTILKEPLTSEEIGTVETALRRLAETAGQGGLAPRFGGRAVRVAAKLHLVLASDCRMRRQHDVEARHTAEALALAPDDPDACFGHARTLVRDGRTLEAMEILDRAQETSSHPRQIERLLSSLIPAATA